MATEGHAVSVTVAEGTGRFFCQAFPSPRLDSLMAALQAAVPSLSSAQCKVGDSCCAQYTADKAWYRARVMNIDGDQASVLYLDYGNRERLPLNTLLSLPPKLGKVPPQAKLCCLWTEDDEDVWPESVQQTFMDLMLSEDEEEEMRMLEVDPAGLDGVTPVRLWIGGRDVASELRRLASTTPSTTNDAVKSSSTAPLASLLSISLGEGKCYEVVVVLKDPDQDNLVYCQLVENAQAFSEFQARLAEIPAPALGSFETGQLCIGRSLEDNVLYRGMVKSECDGDCTVLFVDFGDHQPLPAECLRELPSEFVSFPTQAIPCWIDTSSSVQRAALAGCDDSVIFDALFSKRPDGKYSVRLTAQSNVLESLSSAGSGTARESTPSKTVTSPATSAPRPSTPASSGAAKTPVLPNGHAANGLPVQNGYSNGTCAKPSAQPPVASPPKQAPTAAVSPAKSNDRQLSILKRPCGAVCDVSIADVESADSFWLQDSTTAVGLENLVRLLLKEGTLERAKAPEVGANYLVRDPSRPSVWCRCECVAVSSVETTAFLYDHGRTVTIPTSSVFQWSKLCMLLPHRLAFHCRLSPIARPAGGFPDDIVARLKALKAKDGLLVKIVSGDTSSTCDVVFVTHGGVEVTEQVLAGALVQVPASPPSAAMSIPLKPSPSSSGTGAGQTRRQQGQGDRPVSRGTPTPTGQQPPVTLTPTSVGQHTSHSPQPSSVAASPSYQESAANAVSRRPAAVTTPTHTSPRISKVQPPVMLPAPLCVDSLVDAIVQERLDSQTFWCQLSQFSEELDALQEKLATAFESLPASTVTDWPLSSSCAAIFSEDGVMYRGLVEKVLGPGRVQVRFADFGNAEEHETSTLYPLPAELASTLPMQAFKCTFADGHAAEMAVGQEVSLRVQSVSAGAAVVKLSVEASANATETAVQPPSFPLLPITAGSSHSIQSVYQDAESGTLSCQLLANHEQLAAVARELANMPENSVLPIASVCVGTACCAPSSDGEWYRATVEAIDGADTATVRYVDYGNSDAVESLGILNDTLMTIPAQAVYCTMPDPPLPLDVGGDACDVVFLAEKNGVWTLKPPQASNAGVATCGGHTPAAANQVDISRLVWSAGQKIGIILPVFTSVADFWCVASTSADDMAALGDALAAACESTPALASLPAPGSVCCAQYSEDDLWYRARVLSHETDACKVLFVDYGNEESVPRSLLHPITADLCALPAQAVHCALPSNSGLDRALTDAFCALAQQLEGVEARVTSVHASGFYEVSLFDTTSTPAVDIVALLLS